MKLAIEVAIDWTITLFFNLYKHLLERGKGHLKHITMICENDVMSDYLLYQGPIEAL